MNHALKLADEFNRYFTSSNGVDVPERVSVSRDEWRQLHTALQSRAQVGQVPLLDLPEWSDILDKNNAGLELTPVEQFIHDNEPSGDQVEQFRSGLIRVISHAAAPTPVQEQAQSSGDRQRRDVGNIMRKLDGLVSNINEIHKARTDAERDELIREANTNRQYLVQLITRAIYRQEQAQAEAPNLSDPAVQKRLAAQWGYVPAQATPVCGAQNAESDQQAPLSLTGTTQPAEVTDRDIERVFADHGLVTTKRSMRAARAILALRPSTAPNLACSSVQARLAAQWGYVRPAAVPMTGEQWTDVLGSAGPDLLDLAKQWSDNEVHVYQFVNEAEKIVKSAVLRGITAQAKKETP